MAYCNLDKAIFHGVGEYGIPEIEPYNDNINIKYWLGFNYVKQEKFCRKDIGVHFCLDDYQFETIWNHPNKYIERFRNCGIICSPDFSLYSDFPKAIQVYNHYRKHWLARFYQDREITVIPTIAWSDKESYEWCFDGEPKNSIVAVATIGVLRSEESRKLFMDGYNEMIKRLNPFKIICFCSNGKYDKLDLDNVEYINTSTFKNKPSI